MDVLFLSRLQFALTIGFHYLFPPLTIGLGVLLVIMEGMYLKTRNPEYEAATRFWIKIFALNFAIGVATGIVMEFQFGTNWSTYSRFVGDVFGSALAAEGIFAFFLESGFLAVLVFGWNRVSPRMHFFSTIMVSLGSIFSSVWIVVANSWQQTPAGSKVVQNMIGEQVQVRAEITEFWALVFNPSTMHRLVHVWIGSFILGAFFVMSITAYYILKRRHEGFARKSFTAALAVAAVASLAAIVSGHLQAQNVYRHQPAKLAAFEGHFETGEGGAALSVFGIPDQQEAKVRGEISIPGLLSFLVHDDFSKPVVGLDQFPREDWPPVLITYMSYRVMVGLGVLFVILTIVGLFFRWRGTLFDKRWLMWVFVFAVVGPYIANQLGWVAAEVGRQPWIVQHPVQWADEEYTELTPEVYDPDPTRRGLRTADALSPTVGAPEVLGSIIMFGIIYAMLFAVWVYVLNNKIKHGPEPVEPKTGASEGGFLDTARRAAAAGESMTDVHDESRGPDDDEDRPT